MNARTEVYEYDGKPIIWRYWDKEELPLYGLLLIEAMHCRNPEFHPILVHKSTVYQYLPNLDIPEEVFKILEPAHQADVFRLAILIQYGGVYTDLDVYPLDKIYPLYELLEDYDIVISDEGKIFLGFTIPRPPFLVFFQHKGWT
jgi:mannosyltransferase OCH1-like enzyme